MVTKTTGSPSSTPNYASHVANFDREYDVSKFLNMSNKQHFIIDTWKIDKAWMNPSMAVDPEDPTTVVVVWRMPDKGRHDRIGYMWLDRQTWTIKKKQDMIEIDEPRQYLIGEDARSFQSNGKLYLVYNNHLTKYKKLFYCPIVYNASSDMFYTTNPPNHVSFEGEVNKRHQKNWTPFDFCPDCVFENGLVSLEKSKGHQAKLLFVYTIHPHTIVQIHPVMQSVPNHAGDNSTSNQQPIVGEYQAETIYTTVLDPQDDWMWGEMRGGSPALRIGDKYLTFFHSSGRFTHKIIITYFMGAYLFDAKPPFAITHMSPQPIIANSMMNESFGWAYKVIDYIVFPMGYIVDEDYIYLSYGKNDKDGWIVKFNKTGLLQSLKPVHSKIVGRSRWNHSTNEILRHTYQPYDGQEDNSIH